MLFNSASRTKKKKKTKRKKKRNSNWPGVDGSLTLLRLFSSLQQVVLLASFLPFSLFTSQDKFSSLPASLASLFSSRPLEVRTCVAPAFSPNLSPSIFVANHLHLLLLLLLFLLLLLLLLLLLQLLLLRLFSSSLSLHAGFTLVSPLILVAISRIIAFTQRKRNRKRVHNKATE